MVEEGAWMAGGYDERGHEAEIQIWTGPTGQLVIQGRRFWEPRRFIEVVVPRELVGRALIAVLSVVVDDWQYHLATDMAQVLEK